MADFGFEGALVDDVFDLEPVVLLDLPFGAYYPGVAVPVPPVPPAPGQTVGTPWGGGAGPDSGAFPYWWEQGRVPGVKPLHLRRYKTRPPRRIVAANIPVIRPESKYAKDMGLKYPPESKFRPVTADALADYRRRREGLRLVRDAIRKSVGEYRAWRAERLREANLRAILFLMEDE